jgi:hypothetical protein
VIIDRYLAHYQLYYIFTTPQQDLRLGGTDDVHALSGSITWSKDAAGRSVPTTTLRFKRKLITGDRFDAVINASGPISIVYAWAQGTPGDLRFHGDNHNHVMVDLGVPSGVPRTQFGCEEQGGGARLLLRQAKQGTLVTVQSEVAAGAPAVAPGWPYGSVADFADEVPSSGRPLLLLSHATPCKMEWSRPCGTPPGTIRAVHSPHQAAREHSMWPAWSHIIQRRN